MARQPMHTPGRPPASECGSFLETFPRYPVTEAQPWYCVHTHHGKEWLANAHLRVQGFETFLPTEIIQLKSGPKLKAYFRNYLFVTFKLGDRWQVILSTHGVQRLFLSNSQAPLMVEPRALQSLWRAVDTGPLPTINANTVVKILRGPLQGQHFICRWSMAERVGLLMSIMNREIEVEFRRADVEPLAFSDDTALKP